MDLPRSIRAKRLVFWGAAAVVGGLMWLAWWRNHALLRDFIDYGLVMAAVGRMQAGERPYVDFLTPIQTLQFTLNAWAEAVWGPRYLSLTYAGVVFALGSFAGLTWVLVKPLGRWVALLVAGTVVVASSTQHTIIWYNAMGVTWLAAVVWLAAGRSETERGERLRWIAILAVLWLGGMTKLTYQAAALAFAMLFAVQAAVRGEWTWRRAVGRGASYVGAGTVLPLATEMAYTGASFQQWAYSVVQMAGSRVDLLKTLMTPVHYRWTPHDYYKPMFFHFVGLWGVALLVVIGGLVARGLGRSGRGRGVEWVFLAASLSGAWICGGVLLATNFEIAYLAGAAWLAMAAGIVVAFAGRSGAGGVDRATKGVLAAAALSLAVPAWISAWEGARAVWAPGEMDRADLVSTDGLPAEFGYLRGMKINTARRAALMELAEKKAGWDAQGIPGSSYYFINGTEWLVRVVPEARHRGLPLWLFRGTTITENEVERINGLLTRGATVQVIVEDEAWDVAYQGIREVLAERYSSEEIGLFRVNRFDPMLVRDVLENPARFAEDVGSNVLSRAMRVARGAFELRPSERGRYLCSPVESRLDLDFAVQGLSGEVIAELLPNVRAEVPVVFRVRESEPAGGGRVLWEKTLLPTAGARWVAERFAVEAGGKKLALEMELSGGAKAEGGWRGLKIDRADPESAQRPFPVDRALKELAVSDGWASALFRDGGVRPVEFASFGLDNHAGSRNGVPELFVHVAGEVWFRLDGPAKRLRGEFGVREGLWENASATKGLRATVVQAGGGRFEVLHRQDLWRDDEAVRKPQTFDVALPEAEGWIGLMITPLDVENSSWGQAWWRGFEAE
jgi:hypothetical protein